MSYLSRARADTDRMLRDAFVRKNFNTTKGARYSLMQGSPGRWATDHREESEHFSGWNYVAITALAKQAAKAEVTVEQVIAQRKDGRGLPIGREQHIPVSYDHPLYRILIRPNPSQSGASFRYELMMQLALTGTCLVWHIPNRAGLTVERYVVPTAASYPMQPSSEFPFGAWRIHPWHSAAVHESAGFMESGGWWVGSSKIVDARQMQVVRWPHPWYRDDGWSPTAAGGRWIDTADMIDESRWAHMMNGPDPSVVIEPPEDMDATEEELDAAAERFNSRYAGTHNHGRAMFVRHGKVTAVSFNPRQMQYESGFNQMASAIFAIHGVSKSAVGLNDNMTYGSVAASLRQFISLTVDPTLLMLGDEETEQLAPQFGKNLKVRYKAVNIDDPELLERQIQTDIQAGAITIGELRELRGRDPGEDADRPAIETRVTSKAEQDESGRPMTPQPSANGQSLDNGESPQPVQAALNPPGQLQDGRKSKGNQNAETLPIAEILDRKGLLRPGMRSALKVLEEAGTRIVIDIGDADIGDVTASLEKWDVPYSELVQADPQEDRDVPDSIAARMNGDKVIGMNEGVGSSGGFVVNGNGHMRRSVQSAMQADFAESPILRQCVINALKTVESKSEARGILQSVAKDSSCGAGAPGNRGFQQSNTCAAGEGISVGDETEGQKGHRQDLDGEYWIESGTATFADADIGDISHEGLVIERAAREIIDRSDFADKWDYLNSEYVDFDEFALRFGQQLANERGISAEDYTQAIEDWAAQNNLSEELEAAWGQGDVRDVGMKKYGWTRVAGNNVQTHGLSSSKLNEIADGLWDAFGEEVESQAFDLEDIKTGRLFTNVPFQVISGNRVSDLRDYDARYKAMKRKDRSLSEHAAS